MAEAAHSYWSASKFESIMLCPGKMALEAGKPNTSSSYAIEGTVAHQVLTWCLKSGNNAAHYAGDWVMVDDNGKTTGETASDALPGAVLVDDEMVRHVQTTVDYVREAAQGSPILVDQRVNYAAYLGVPEDDAWGTLDVTILHPDEIHVIDFKYGRGVEVDAGSDALHPNPQLALYALGALAFDFGGEAKNVRLAISQPRLSAAPSELPMTVVELEEWAGVAAFFAVGQARAAVAGANDGLDIAGFLRPGEKQCKFCLAKATCPALRAEVATSVAGFNPATPEEFAEAPVAGPEHLQPADADWLGAIYPKLDMIDGWCKAVLAEIERRLLAGESVPGTKLVQGRQGARSWTSAAEAEAALKAMRLKVEEMYELSLISPTSAEKLAPAIGKDGKPRPVAEGAPAPAIGPRQWAKLQSLIERKPGKIHVAPMSDKREAVQPAALADDFKEDFA